MKSIFFIITVVVIVCRPFFAVFDYAINYEKIVLELCINRNKPEITCNGVCYLKDQISKTVETEKSTDKSIPNVKTLDFFTKSNILNIPFNISEFKPNSFYLFKCQIIKLIYLDKLLNPPI